MANASIQTTAKVPENSINQLFQELESLKKRIFEVENFRSNNGNNWTLSFLISVLILLGILILYFNYRTNLKLNKLVQNQPRDSGNNMSSEKDEDFVEEFIKKVINFASKIPQTPVSEPLVNQLVKVVSSIGAILVWTKNSDSKRDFHYKIDVCKKKVQETEYWLKMISFTFPELKNETKKLIQEAEEMKRFLDFFQKDKNY